MTSTPRIHAQAGPAQRSLPRRPGAATILGVALLTLSVAVYGVAWMFVLHQPFHIAEPRPHSFDLRVYRAAARAVLHGRHLYQLRLYGGLGFTYPPIAALLFIPNLWLPEPLDVAVIATLNIAMLLAIVALTPRLAPDPRRRARRAAPWRWATVAVVTALALWLEPVSMAVGYGQIDLLVTLLVVWDLARPRDARGRGVGVGIAAGLKLTPLIFIPYLLLARDRRAAITATLAFGATIVVGFLVLPADSVRFWGTTFLRSSRAGDVAAPINQSLFGLIARALHTVHVGPVATAAVAVAGLSAVIAAARATRRGDEGVGFAVCAFASLLVSPISWTHHWVIAVPAAGVLGAWAWRRRQWWPRLTLAALGLLGLAAAAYLPEMASRARGTGPGPYGVWFDPYVILGSVAVVAAIVASERGRAAARVAEPRAAAPEDPVSPPRSAVATYRR